MNLPDCILLSPFDDKRDTFSIYPYLGLGYLAAVLEQSGINTQIIDIKAGHFLISDVLKKIPTQKKVVVGLSVLSKTLPFTFRLIQAIQKAAPNAIIVAGGPHISFDPEIIKTMGIPYGLKGESEFTFTELCKHLLLGDPLNKNLDGLVLNSENEFTDNPAAVIENLDELPDPDYSQYDLTAYTNIIAPRLTGFTIITSRGCAYRCEFCSNSSRQIPLRFHSLDVVYRQIKKLVVDKGVQWLEFVDDTFTFDRQRVIDLCNWIVEHNIIFRWGCWTRVDKTDFVLLETMYKAGLRRIGIGVESGCESLRYADNKKIQNSNYHILVRQCNELGIDTVSSYILGHPGEKTRQMWQTIKFSLKLPTTLSHYFMMIPIPGSLIFKRALCENKISKSTWSDFMLDKIKFPFYYPDNVSPAKLKYIYTLAFILYYFRPHKVFLLMRLLFTNRKKIFFRFITAR